MWKLDFSKSQHYLINILLCYGLSNKGQEILALFLPKRRPKMFSGTFIFHLTNKLGHDVIGLLWPSVAVLYGLLTFISLHCIALVRVATNVMFNDLCNFAYRVHHDKMGFLN